MLASRNRQSCGPTEIVTLENERNSKREGRSRAAFISASISVEQNRDSGNARRNFLEQFHPLAPERSLRHGETGDVSTRPGKSSRRSRCRPDRQPSRKRWG